MAHPLAVNEVVTSGPGMILKKPELASLIGCICSDWSHVESSIETFYSFLMGIYLPKNPGFEPPTHPVARQVMDELVSIHAKINLLERLASWVIQDEEQLKDAKQVLTKTRGSGKERNKVAHGIWGVCESEPDALILMPVFGDKMIYKKQDFEKILESINKTQAEIWRICNRFVQQRRQN